VTTEHTDIIFLRELRVGAVIGIYEWEQRVRQTVSIDLEMTGDVREAASSDDIEHTINYKAVADRVVGYVEESRFQLIETLAERVAEILLKEFKIRRVKVTVIKPGAVRAVRAVGVVIERSA
jgi:dihydroneopterin aldolase